MAKVVPVTYQDMANWGLEPKAWGYENLEDYLGDHSQRRIGLLSQSFDTAMKLSEALRTESYADVAPGSAFLASFEGACNNVIEFGSSLGVSPMITRSVLMLATRNIQGHSLRTLPWDQVVGMGLMARGALAAGMVQVLNEEAPDELPSSA